MISPPLRIALAGIVHETNTYCRDLTTAADFHQIRGERILRTRDQQSDIGGAVAACEAAGIEPVPLLYAQAHVSSW